MVYSEYNINRNQDVSVICCALAVMVVIDLILLLACTFTAPSTTQGTYPVRFDLGVDSLASRCK